MSYYIIIRGPLGCGKSTLAKQISQNISGEYFSVDEFLEQHGLNTHKEEGYISQQSFKKANEIMIEKAKKSLQNNVPVVFDGNFYWISQIEDLCSRLVFPHYVFTLHAPVAVCMDRDKNRKNSLGEGAVRAVFKKSTEFDYGQVIDVDKPLHLCIKEIQTNLPKND